MDRNTIIAFILIGLVLLLWPVYMKRVVGVKQPIRQEPVESDEIVSEAPLQTETPSLAGRVETTPAVPARPRLSPPTQKGKPDTLVVETDLFRGKLSSMGGGTVVSWKLKKYFQGDKRDSVLVELIPDSSNENLGLVLGGGLDLSDTVFKTARDSQWVEDGKRRRMIGFVHDVTGGGWVEREIIVEDGRYDIEVRIRFFSIDRAEMGGGYTVQWTNGLASTERNTKDDLHYYEAYALQGGELLKTKEKSTGLREGATDWVAVRTKYFLMALIPREMPAEAAQLEGRKVEDWKEFAVQLVMPFRGLPEETGRFTLYLGPMDYPQLKGVGVGLEKMMNFGWVIIRPFSIAFFYTLQFLHRIVGSYGWAIIIFSIMIKIVLYPLTRKSYQSMRQMQELQPKMAALKEKYKNDPQKLNQETMKLYKQHGVNPMGGCLPMLLQMPILFALFNLFRTTIMLRQAGFLGLIQDLSAPDAMIALGGASINVLPILMGITMIVQQKLSTQNPQQKAMAYLMPIFLTFIFYRLSAGLNLYYLMFNVLTIAQEMVIKKK